ncbi:MAG: sigma-E factor negative regulatory protein [Burkholderiales bacterium]|nr:sigma-E factor negative regulatory protein [Burkholderiales bacterium]
MKERLSALMDDELRDAECSECLDRLGKDDALRKEWALYHLIGDALRGTAAHELPDSFRDLLAAEPTVLAPPRARDRSARDGAWHYAMYAAAGVAAVAAVGWMALPQLQPAVGPAVVTAPQAPTTLTAAAAGPGELGAPPAAAVPVARNMDDYLIAHQRFSPSSAMSGVAPYVRTVADSDQPR